MTELYHRETPAPAGGVPARGDGHYPAYHALWHLFEIGVVTDLAEFKSEAWTRAEDAATSRPTRVALIDVSVAYRHPNLEHAVAKDLMIDFFSAKFGAFPYPEAAAHERDKTLADLCDAAKAPATEGTAELFEKLTRGLPGRQAAAAEPWDTPGRVLPATSPMFSAHGTAMAGLIGARPRGRGEVAFLDTVRIPLPGAGALASQQVERRGFPYAGVDPTCEIVPISTSFDPDPEQLICALLYAHIIDADVIVIARDYADPFGNAVAGPSAASGKLPQHTLDMLEAAYPIPIPASERALWTALGALTIELSKRIPIVCAAGNGGDRTMILPAALAAPDNGIIAVGARAATGKRAGYSTTGDDGGASITVYAPSGDGERLDEELQRLDTLAPGFRPEDHSEGYLSDLGVQIRGDGTKAAKLTEHTFSTQEIVSTDVPGAAGYNGSAFSPSTAAGGGVLDYRSYYCHFSGTSAATAITAGLVSLAISAGKIARGDGKAAKAALTGGAAVDDAHATPHLAWGRIPQPPR